MLNGNQELCQSGGFSFKDHSALQVGDPDASKGTTALQVQFPGSRVGIEAEGNQLIKIDLTGFADFEMIIEVQLFEPVEILTRQWY